MTPAGEDKDLNAAPNFDALMVMSRKASGTHWLTILKYPPPASFLNFTKAKSGSMPVVSQSMSRPIVPVGASTVDWALR